MNRADDSTESEGLRTALIKNLNTSDADGKQLRANLNHGAFSSLYLKHLDNLLGHLPEFKALKLAAPALLQDMTDSIKPRDAIEEMLVHQAAWAHARTAHLSLLTVQANTLEPIDRLSAATERASNTFRKLMIGLAEYRRAPKPPVNMTTIRQANIASQQVVQNQGQPASIEKCDERTRIEPCPLTAESAPHPSKQMSVAKPKKPKSRRANVATD